MEFLNLPRRRTSSDSHVEIRRWVDVSCLYRVMRILSPGLDAVRMHDKDRAFFDH